VPLDVQAHACQRAGQGVWFHVLPCRARGGTAAPPAPRVVVPHCWTRDTGTTRASNGRSPMCADRRRRRDRRPAGRGEEQRGATGRAGWSLEPGAPTPWRARSRSWLRACAVGGSVRPATGTAARAPTSRRTPRTLVAPRVVGSDTDVSFLRPESPSVERVSRSAVFFSLTRRSCWQLLRLERSRTRSSRQTGLAPDTSRRRRRDRVIGAV